MKNLDLTKPIVTVKGVPVTLFNVQGRGSQPLIGYLSDSQVINQWTLTGKFLAVGNSVNDLVNAPEEPVRVPLGPEDVPPGSVLRRSNWAEGGYVSPSVWDQGVSFAGATEVISHSYTELFKNYEILRPGQTEWQPCWKEIDA